MTEYEKPTTYRQMTTDEQSIVDKCMRLWGELSSDRSNFENQWEEIAELVEPTFRGTFMRGSVTTPGEKKTERQVDATAMLALSRFAAICDSLSTPRNMTWHGLAATNEYVQKNRAVQLWFEKATRALFKIRYAPLGNFSSQNHQNYRSIGAFGNGGMFTDRLVGHQGQALNGIRYKSIPLGEVYVRENHQGLVDSFVRFFRLTARQAVKRWSSTCPEQLWGAMDQQTEAKFDFLHVVVPNDSYDPLSFRSDKKTFASYYISITGRCLLYEDGRDSHGGYNTFPLSFPRYDQAPGETYGRGPAGMVLPAEKSLNAMKTTHLKTGHRAADPILLTTDDGLMDGFSLRPGALNKGGMSADGKPLVGTVPVGNLQYADGMMEGERGLINDAFLVTLFQILIESPTMTATEVIERINEKGILLAPTVGRLQAEYIGPLIERELDLLVQMKVLDPMPPLLREAKGEYEVVYTSPLAKAQRAQEAAGFMRTLEIVNNTAQVTQDPSLYDIFNFDVALPAIADIQSVPPSWLRGDAERAQLRAQRAKAQERQQQTQEAPAKAALMKAQAAQAEAGVGQAPVAA